MNNIINLTKLSILNLKSVSKQMVMVLVIWGGISIANPNFLTIFLGMGVYMIIYQIMAYEDMAGIDNLISTIPVKRTEYVISRYIIGAITSMLVIIITVILYSISPTVNKNEMPLNMLLITGLTISALSNSIIIPITMKMGINKGRLFTICLTLLLSMGPAMLFGYLKEKSEFGEKLIEFISNMNMYVALIGMNSVMIIISIICAIKFYKGKEIK